jgi:hypothetical protein
VADYLGGGLWIPLLFFAGAFLYASWILYRNLDQLRTRGRRLDEGLGEILLQYRVALEKVKEAESLIEAGEIDRAIHQLQEIQRAYPTLSTTDYFLGKAFHTTGDTTQAREHFQRFLTKTRPYDAISRERVEEAQRHLSGFA